MTMNGKTCETCTHAHGEHAQQRECRRYPPQMVQVGIQQSIRGPVPMLTPAIPVVAIDYRCGEWTKGAPRLSIA